jgi:pimeloyl-ACP methyl ester carboxylesterase
VSRGHSRPDRLWLYRPARRGGLQGSKQADFLIEAIEQFDLNPVTLVGNSEGLFGTIYIALNRPDLVEKVIIFNSRTPRPEEPSGDLFEPEPERERLRKKIEETRAEMFVVYEHHPFYRDPLTEKKVDRYYKLKELLY